MEQKNVKFQDGLAELEKYISGAVAKMAEHKAAIKKLNSEINELKRLHALSDKKADRLKRELDDARSNNGEAGSLISSAGWFSFQPSYRHLKKVTQMAVNL